MSEEEEKFIEDETERLRATVRKFLIEKLIPIMASPD